MSALISSRRISARVVAGMRASRNCMLNVENLQRKLLLLQSLQLQLHHNQGQAVRAEGTKFME